MSPASLYERLLWLYPPDFRQQFSAEMLSVFKQRASDRIASGNLSAIAHLLTEFASLIKGAYVMWLSKIVPISRKSIQHQTSEASGATLTLAGAKTAREEALKQMVTAIANHDFAGARHYSEEEYRLKASIEIAEKGSFYVFPCR